MRLKKGVLILHPSNSPSLGQRGFGIIIAQHLVWGLALRQVPMKRTGPEMSLIKEHMPSGNKKLTEILSQVRLS
jgi:hypothetical protein